MNLTKQYAVALSILFTFFVADFFITKSIIGYAGYDAEANTAMHWVLLQTNNVYSLLGVKLFAFWCLTMVTMIVNAFAADPIKRRLVFALWALVAVTICVDFWSMYVLRVVS
jgi:hypothetical protein